jgi:hypothetical protein
MTLDKAIKIGTIFEKGEYPGSAIEFREMVKLGVEALKRCKEARKKAYFTTRSLLPGETEE